MDKKTIKLTKLKANTGQIEGVPENPRKWTRTDIDRLVESIKETPELLEARPLIVYENGKEYVVLGGNLRLSALRSMGVKETPCFIFKEMDAGKLKEIVMKDNSSFGDWDTDELANDVWSDYDLDGWGVRNVAGADTAGDMDFSGKNSELNTDDWSDDMTMKFKLHPDEYEFVKKRLEGKDARVEILNLVGYGE